MNCKKMPAAIDAKKMWFTEGKTPRPRSTSAIIREIKAKGKDSRLPQGLAGQVRVLRQGRGLPRKSRRREGKEPHAHPARPARGVFSVRNSGCDARYVPCTGTCASLR